MTDHLQWFRWGVFYLGVHLLVYVLVLRHVRFLRSERAIFLYHAISGLALVCVLLGALAMAPRSSWLVSALGLISLYGIYSLSFLELWSLAEGSYSLSILDHVEVMRAVGAEVNLTELHSIGAWKRGSRVESLLRLRLVRRQGERLGLTALGRVAAMGLCLTASALRVRKG